MIRSFVFTARTAVDCPRRCRTDVILVTLFGNNFLFYNNTLSTNIIIRTEHAEHQIARLSTASSALATSSRATGRPLRSIPFGLSTLNTSYSKVCRGEDGEGRKK